MYMQRITMQAANGRMPDLFELVRAEALARQSDNLRIAITTPITGMGTQISVNIRFESLSELQELRDRNRDDAHFQAFIGRIAPLMAGWIETELWESIIPPPEGVTPHYVQMVKLTPTLGKNFELVSVMSDRARERQAGGLNCALWDEVAGDPLRINFALLFDSLADYERYRSENRNNPAFQSFMNRVSPMLDKSPQFELHEVMVPFQAARQREMVGAAQR